MRIDNFISPISFLPEVVELRGSLVMDVILNVIPRVAKR